jgi:hypothetical protein
MNRMRLGKGRWPVALAIGLAALAIGSVFGAAQSGQAASAVVPNNTAPPIISGTPQQGSTLTTSDGTWTGTAPLAFTYAWGRCDQNGASCATISGATGKTYDLKLVDVGNTLRSIVTATNTDGKDTSTSVPTAVVAAAAVTPPPVTNGCPSGSGPIAIADLSSPARLAIDQQTVSPGLVTLSATAIQTHFRVTACGGRPVQGALVYATAVPFNQYSIAPEGTTAADGTVVLTMAQLSGFPAARRQQLLVVFVRARKAGEDVEGGISSRLLVSFPVSLTR